jgi:hypothetical protein
MQTKKHFQKIFNVLLMTSLVLMPLFTFTKNAQAQSQGFYTTSGGSSANLQGYIKGLAPAITQLPLCKKTLKGGTANLFSKLSGKFGGDKPKEISPYQTEGAGTGIESESAGAGEQVDAIQVYSTTLNTNTAAIQSAADKISASADSLDTNDTCLKSIGRMVTKLLLQKITVSTVNWINTGYEGKPTFLSNEDDFWGNIAKNEILQFGLEIDNQTLFPFGKAFMEAQAQAFQRQFADNAQYSLDKLIADTNPQYSSITFNADFSQGGWAAWDAMTQIPANNPLGFQLLASNELQLRLEGTGQSYAQSLRDDIQRGMGFMSQDICVNPEGVTHEENEAALAGDTTKSRCLEWKHVTPGSIIAETATNAVNYPNNQLLKSEDLNDAVAAILDAVINQWSTKLFSNTGFAGISTQGSDGSYFHNTNAQTSYNTQVENDFPYANSTWLKENPDFNIRTDLTQALIDEQRIYSEKLAEQNDQLFVKVKTPQQAVNLGLNPTSMVGRNYGLLPIIYQLDYCIPGPHPGFEEDAQISLDKALSLGGTPVGETTLDKALGLLTKLDSFSPLSSVAGNTTASGTIGTILNLINPDKDITAARQNNANIIKNFAGVEIHADGSAPVDFDGVTIILQSILNGYIQVVHNVYNTTLMPDVTKEATLEFEKAPSYLKMLENNINDISKLKSVVARLTQIKGEVDKLNQQLQNNSITQAQYDENIKPWISAFGRISSEMVTGDDIAKADNTLKQIKDKEVYIYNDLLKGPNGCESVLHYDPTRPNLPYGFIGYRRYAYPLPIIYDYNIYTETDELPDYLYNPVQNNTKSLFKINNLHGRYGNRISWFTGAAKDKVGLAGVTFGAKASYGLKNNGTVWPEYRDFCGQIAIILNTNHSCAPNSDPNNFWGPTVIYITDMVNIHQEADAQTLEKSLGIY